MAVSPDEAGRDYPRMIAAAGHTEPAPRRVRATLGGETVFDTTRARYVWEWANYPQYSHRHVRVSLEGITLAMSATPVLVFETGLPTRYYVDRTDVDFGHLVPTATQTACPYKGVTSGYWSVRTGGEVRDGHQDLAWAYDFPTRQLLPIAGLVAFYNEKVDIDLDGVRLPRPKTHFS